MRQFSVDTVVMTHEAAALVEPEVLENARRQGLVVIVANPTDLEIDGTTEGDVGVGVSANDVRLYLAVDIYFHVGDAADLGRKLGVTVPLTNQGGVGVRNVLRWALATRSAPQPIANHSDVARYAERCAIQYRDAGHVDKMEGMSREAVANLMAAFPEVQVVLGTGFPFYCMDRADRPDRSPTPTSILYYTTTQADFFRRKFVPDNVQSDLETKGHRVFTPEQLLEFGSDVGQTSFNAYEYRRWSVEPPAPPPIGTLSEFVEANTLELKDRDWPCHLCTTLHDSSRYPEQAWERDFMLSCVRCNQTSFLPRAVGVLGSDIDLVALAPTRQDPIKLAREIARWIDSHPQYFRHDTRWNVQLGCEHGPLDVFVTTIERFLAAANQIADADDWMGVTVEAAVTWLPVTRIDYELGKYMPLCMELLRDNTVMGPTGFTHLFDQARRRFAMRVTARQVLDAYTRDSKYLQQLASNPSVAKTLRTRLSLWRNESERAEV
jgi:hypothetical protein